MKSLFVLATSLLVANFSHAGLMGFTEPELVRILSYHAEGRCKEGSVRFVNLNMAMNSRNGPKGEKEVLELNHLLKPDGTFQVRTSFIRNIPCTEHPSGKCWSPVKETYGRGTWYVLANQGLYLEGVGFGKFQWDHGIEFDIANSPVKILSDTPMVTATLNKKNVGYDGITAEQFCKAHPDFDSAED